MREALVRLAVLHGIAPEYYDIWGKRHHVSDEALVALLGAIDVTADSHEAIDAALTGAMHERWAALLPPVQVVRAPQRPWRLRVNVSAALHDTPLQWGLIEENGHAHSGEFVPSQLPELERAETPNGVYTARELTLDVAVPLGYHRLRVSRGDDAVGEMAFIVAPMACHMPEALRDNGRVWGAALQLYGVRSERNWGLGDFGDLLALIEEWGQRGAGIIGLNPLHALFPHNPWHNSPYSPSSRLFKNVLYLDVEAVEDFRACEAAIALVRAPEFEARLNALRDAEEVDYPGVAEVKFKVLEQLYSDFRERHLRHGTQRAMAFREFQRIGGLDLRRHTLFEALQEHFHRQDSHVWGWPVWPEPYRDPAAVVVAQFEREFIERVEFYAYLQWQADVQLAAAGKRAHDLQLGVGVYEDLAVSIDRGGAEAWANQDLYALTASVGAPPDDFNLKGQNWGLPPLIPERLRAVAYRPFVETLRATMRHSGAVRIDHVMGLARLFWVPPGRDATQGAYMRYPFQDLLGILALESHRHRCLVIGEDLGTVPDEVREALALHCVLSYRLLYFERRDGGDFKAPGEYPREAIVSASTHDLPTLAGWWEGRDIALRTELHLFPDDAMREHQLVARAQDRARLLLALEREGLLPSELTADPASVPQMTPELIRAISSYLAATPARVLVVQLEDVLNVPDQANMPGTTEECPNWRRKLPLTIERLRDDPRFIDLASAVGAKRGASRPKPIARSDVKAIIPRATYRLQLHREFNFDAATRIVPYLADLGVSHVYCSPYLRARAGSTHGYDIIDHNALNPEIGDRAAFERFVDALKSHGMGQILDMVPNHMGIMGADNAWWLDVLENGSASLYADYFDIDWHPLDPTLQGKVLVPVLGDHYGSALEHGDLQLAFDVERGCFVLNYYEHRLPIDPQQYPILLQAATRLLAPNALAPQVQAEWEALAAAFGYLPSRDSVDPAALTVRQRDKEVHKARLAELVRTQPPLVDAVQRALRRYNGVAGERASFDALDELLEAQAYRLAYWRVASDEINYRRFFDINDLAALRMENNATFDATHRFVLDLAAQGKIDGIRIDHPDGLYDPAGYFARVQKRYAQLAGADEAPETRPLYVVIEKITAPHEDLPEQWPVHGTTGYRYANVLNGVFVDTLAKSAISRTWSTFVGEEAVAFEESAYRGKRLIMKTALAAELTVLSNRLLRLARADRRTRDFTLNTLRQALAEVVASFPVYRTYIGASASVQDRRYVDWAVSRAKRRIPAAEDSIFEFIRSVLLLQPPEGAPSDMIDRYRALTMRFQQYTAPVTAKGVEDTAFYRYNRLVSLNEVGGDPHQFGMTVKAFHGASAARALHWPHTMAASSTHDNKRSEDVRARINVLSEMPANWRLALRRWSRINRARSVRIEGQQAPSRNDEYLLYQILLGSFPTEPLDAESLAVYRERIERYMIKAMREAKSYTSWLNENRDYEQAVLEFVHGLLGKLEDNLFLDDFHALAQPVAWYGALNSIAQTLVKLASPGVPDTYQGNETLDFSLVDPDNRRPVDYARRRHMLDEMKALAARNDHASAVRGLLEHAHDGRAKLWVTWCALQLRREREALFRQSDYLAVAAEGETARHVLSFARRHNDSGIVVATGRLYASLGLEVGQLPLGATVWGEAMLDVSFVPNGAHLTNVLTGEMLVPREGKLPLADVFANFSAALLVYG
ncbi:MAG TPA: malto-oligosyltrehalose synthase [Burkholderiales bacterium]